MGSSQSVHEVIEDEESESEEDEEEEEEEEEDEDDDDDDDDDHGGPSRSELEDAHLVEKKLLEQEPEVLPCHASASPLSPQLSSLGTPRLGPSIKVWDPYNVLAPPPPLPPPPPVFARSYSMEEDRQLGVVEVFLISHGECELSLRPDLVGGRCSEAGLTANGKRQVRALAVLLNSQGVRFSSVYSSPLDRARFMAILVCQEMNFPTERIQPAEALTEMSQGHWEGCPTSEVYTPEMLALMDRQEPDFSTPEGESLREVQFRMVQFLNRTVMSLPEKIRSDFFSDQNPNSIHERDSALSLSLPSPRWHRRGGLTRKKSGKSRLQFVNKGDHHDAEDDGISSSNPSSSCIGIFSHSVPIKCLVAGILGCSAAMSHKILIEDSSVTVLQHSWKTGWQIKRMNDTGHLRLL